MKFIHFLCSFTMMASALVSPSTVSAQDSAQQPFERSVAIVRVTLEDAQGRVLQRTTRAMDWGDANRFELDGTGKVVELGVHQARGGARVTSSYLPAQGPKEKREMRTDFGSTMVAHGDETGRVLVTVRSARIRLHSGSADG